MNKVEIIHRRIMRKILSAVCVCACAFSLSAQQTVTITGVVNDENGDPMPGATVILQGSTGGAVTGVDGSFSLNVPATGSILEVSFVGYETAITPVDNRRVIAVRLKPKAAELEEVTIVAFGTQKKESVISAIQTVNTKELKVPSSNLTTALSGRIAGLISYQTSGEPGFDNASFFIRGVTTFGAGKVDPLILVDNVEVGSSDLANLHPDDLQSFSILKDATATALYGARGANGVILITTKEGREGKPQVNVRFENSFSSPTDVIKMADPITYMRLANEAVTTRNPLMPKPYSDPKIDNTLLGRNPYVYPAVDWMDMLFKNYTSNQRANMNISGGGTVARYYIAASFSQDNGILKVDKRNNFNNNISYKKYLLHSNVNINVTKATEMIVRLHGTFNDYQGPIMGGSDLYRRTLKVSPVRFPAVFEPDEFYSKAQHILFGNTSQRTYFNPYAEMLRGYKLQSNSTMMAQVEVKQNFEKLIPGLTGRIMGNTSRYAGFNNIMAYSPFWYEVTSYDRVTDSYTLNEINPDGGSEYLRYSQGEKNVNYSMYGEASLNYSRKLGDRQEVSGMLVGQIRHYLTANEDLLVDALPSRNLGLSGRFTYAYDSRYFAEFNFGYNGSEKFDEGHRWGFFPSFGLGWNLSNEQFWTEGMKKYVSKFRLRGTYGLVGNDDISDTRFFYISEVNPNGTDSFRTGDINSPFSRTGYSVRNYPNSNITWEVSQKSNLGVELGLLGDKINIQADIFHEYRQNILQDRADLPIEMGLWSTPKVNIGKAYGNGVDISVDYQQNINTDLWFIARGNFTYARSTYAYYEEAKFDALGTPWRKREGQPVSQTFGYVAERLFIDNNEVAGAARQDFSRYEAGDVRYKDMNNDRVINSFDLAPIGYPRTPEINYGFGLSAGYKGFDVSFFFSGSARSSFFIDAGAMRPFVLTTDTNVPGYTFEGGLTQFIADDHWTEASQNPYALWPRLTNDSSLSNNTQTSTWWMRNGDYLRLKSAEIGYSLPGKLVSRWRMASLRFYLSGTNLLLFSNFKLWDIELGGNGLNYPLQRVVNIGVNMSF
ncbi:MAG: TonB-dependent receptor [Bacteroidales bacterium]|jgi:TonB-linked SusC/RagA family outer membrane protein|nr:TonB-dependent receptor [Bacteroidales bacterium]